MKPVVKASNVNQRKRQFTELGRPIQEVYDMLLQKKILTPLHTKPPTNLRGDKSKYCEFHEYHGHALEQCFRLKHEIQNLIEDGVIPDPSKETDKWQAWDSEVGRKRGREEEKVEGSELEAREKKLAN